MSKEYTDKDYMEMAFRASIFSHDLKTQVGAVLVSTNGFVVDGANTFLKEGLDSFSKEKHKYVVHAEAVCLLKVSTEDYENGALTMYVTLEPCQECAKLIAGSCIIGRVVFCHSKPKGSGVELLRELGIKVDQFQEDVWHG